MRMKRDRKRENGQWVGSVPNNDQASWSTKDNSNWCGSNWAPGATQSRKREGTVTAVPALQDVGECNNYGHEVSQLLSPIPRTPHNQTKLALIAWLVSICLKLLAPHVSSLIHSNISLLLSVWFEWGKLKYWLGYVCCNWQHWVKVRIAATIH